MIDAPTIAWLVLGVGLVAWVLTGGADLGGGVWDLLATGPRRQAQRDAIARALAPIWEANHVWLIFVIVVLFTAFPKAFAAIGIALHIPIAAALVGLVLRGAAFTFRAYALAPGGGPPPESARARWGRVFAIASLITPVFLGMTLAATSSGAIRLDPGAPLTTVTTGYWAGWTTPYAVLVGLFALALFALLAAVYLTLTTAGAVREDFRLRALATEVVAGALALAVWTTAPQPSGAPALAAALRGSAALSAARWLTAAFALATCALLWRRRFRLARLSVAAQVTLVVAVYGLATDGHLVTPDLTIRTSGAHPATLAAVLPAVAIGALLLIPSMIWLFRVFRPRA